jgi:hypothetical protein
MTRLRVVNLGAGENSDRYRPAFNLDGKKP